MACECLSQSVQSKITNHPLDLPKLTYKQRQIIQLIYQFRFLNRIQIQAFLKHKDYKTINLWLKDLREKHYVEWIYSEHFAERTKPAIYYLGLNAIRYLNQVMDYPGQELRKRYRDSTRSQTFIDRSLLLDDCCLGLDKLRTESITYHYETEADYLKDSYYHFLADSDLRPNLAFCKDKYDYFEKEDVTVNDYLLEIFEPTLPRYRIKKRLENYVNYLQEGDWEEEMDTDRLPIILLVCQTTSDLIYAKRRTRGLLADVLDCEDYDDDDEDEDENEADRKHIHIRFTTTAKLKASGLMSDIWEEA